MKKIILIVILTVFSTETFSQNPRKEHHMGISIHTGGPGLSKSVALDFFIHQSFNFEFGVGFSGFVISIVGQVPFAGITYHFFGRTDSKFTPFTGVFLAQFSPMDYHDDYPTKVGLLYIPVGIQFFSNNGFTTSIEGALSYDKTESLFDNQQFSPYAGFKIGFHFGSSNKTKKGNTKRNRGDFEIERKQLENRNKLY